MRLIDADELRKQMYHEAFETDTDMQRWDGGCWIRYKMFENVIESTPTVDPVKHGWWEDENMDDQVVARCSVCNIWDTTRTPYCPNCGAKMDGDKNE